MKLTTWIKANPFIAAAIALPIVVIGFFLTATTIPHWLVDDPQYDMLFSLDRHGNDGPPRSLKYSVVNGVLMAEANPLPVNGYSNYQRLYRFHAADQTITEIMPQIPEAVLQAVPATAPPEDIVKFDQPFPVAELSGVRLLNTSSSPDGYIFDNQYRGSRGLFGELFGMSSRGYRFGILKQGRVISLQVAGDGQRYYRGARSLGWVDQ